MPAGRVLNAGSCIDDQQRRLGTGRAGYHVLQEFKVSRGIDDDVRTPGGLEEDPCRIDRDALALLLLEGVDQEGIFERFRVASAGSPYLFELAGRKRARISEQSTDDRAFPVIDMPYHRDVHDPEPLTILRPDLDLAEVGPVARDVSIPKPALQVATSPLLAGIRLAERE